MIMRIINFLNENSGALTFLITAIYVFATIKICCANAASAKATKDQLNESKRQFDEETRLHFLPWLQVKSIAGTKEMKQMSFSTIHACSLQFDEYQKTKSSDLECPFYFSIRNIGHDVAVRTELHWEYNGIITPSSGFAVLVLGENKNIRFYVQAYGYKEPYSAKATLVFKYQDLLNNSYSQKIELTFEINEFQIILSSIGTMGPELIAEEGANNA